MGHLGRKINIHQTTTLTCRASANPPGIERLITIADIAAKQRLVLGKERAFFSDKGFKRGEVNHQIIALHLTKIRINRTS